MTLFDRVPGDVKPVLEAARSLLPPQVLETITPRFLCGIDPVSAGLHRFDDIVSFNGLAWRRASGAHACYTHHTPDRKQTIVLPDVFAYPDPVATVLHEYGHLYDEATGFQQIHLPVTTRYSKVNRAERFAEAFETVLRPPSGEWELFTQSEAFRPLRELVGA